MAEKEKSHYDEGKSQLRSPPLYEGLWRKTSSQEKGDEHVESHRFTEAEGGILENGSEPVPPLTEDRAAETN